MTEPHYRSGHLNRPNLGPPTFPQYFYWPSFYPCFLRGLPPLGAMPPPSVINSIPLPTFTTPTWAPPPLFVPPTAQSSLESSDLLLSSNFPPIPAKLVNRICRWEFFELNQLLPDNIVTILTDIKSKDSKSTTKEKKLPPIEDIQSWSIAMLLYTATIHSRYPHKTGELLVYMANILQTSMTYPVDDCLAYDRVFRAQAHPKPSFDWGSDNTKLWNNKFSVRAKPKPCTKCKSTLHASVDCLMDDLSNGRKQAPSTQPVDKSSEVCMGFNIGGCSLQQCPRQHLCYRCSANHGLVNCPKARSFFNKGRSFPPAKRFIKPSVPTSE